jgi:HlyD family secretion protein
MKKHRWIIIFGIVIAVILLIVYGFLPKPASVDTAKVKRGTFSVAVEEEGKTRVKERFVLSAPVSGYMRRITLDAGDAVKKGQVVAELEPLRSAVLDPRSKAEAEAAVSAAEAALKAAEERQRSAAAEAAYAASSLDRLLKLFKEGYVSQDKIDQTQQEAKRTEAVRLSAEADVKVARFELDKARSVLRYSAAEGAFGNGIVRVSSPVDGRVLKLRRESEGAVSTGEPLIDIGDPSALEVAVEVLSDSAVSISAGTPVTFERWGQAAPLEGIVRVVEPEGFTKISSLGVEEQRVLVIADFTSPREEWMRLGDAYRVEARFITWQGKDVLQAPASALFRRDSDWAIFVVKEGRAHERRIKVGHQNGLESEILSGLQEGEEVILYPDESIKDGTRVKRR